MAKSNDSKKEKRFSKEDSEREAPNRKADDYVKRNATSENGYEGRPGDPKSLVSEAVQQAITGMVQLSSSVIEEQIRAGQAAASRLRDGLSTSDKLSGDINTLVDNLVATTKDVGNAWVDLLTIVLRSLGTQPSSNGCPPSSGYPPPGGAGAGPRTKTAISGSAKTTSRVTPSDPATKAEPPEIVVRGSGVKEVTLDLRPPSMRFVPVVRPLLASDPKNSIVGAKFGLNAQRKLVLTVDVPRGQPAGIYTGLIVDSTTNEPGGTVSVTVGG